jgi:predicted nucleic acid-binding protein
VEPVTVPRAAIFDTSIFVGQEARGLGPLSQWTPLVSVITLAELMLGVEMSASSEIRSQRSQTLADARRAPCVGISRDGEDSVLASWVKLRKAVGRRIPINDSWIAATAMMLGVPILTRDSDYDTAAELVEIIKL